MNILIFGDVVGKSGRTALSCYLAPLKEKYKIDFTIVNGENSAHGKGITPRIYKEFTQWGVDCITLGNHAFSKHNIVEELNLCPKLVYPNNHPSINNGFGDKIFEVNGQCIHVINVLGNAFMLPEPSCSCFDLMHEALKKIDKNDCVIVDFHGEATAEKRAFFETFNNRCSIIYGTHTHVQTADEMIKNGCAFISDVGMVGAYDSVLGRDIHESLQLYRGKKTRYLPSDNPAIICAIVVCLDEKTLQAKTIERIQIRP